MKVILLMERKMEKAHTLGRMVNHFKVNGLQERKLMLESIKVLKETY